MASTRGKTAKQPATKQPDEDLRRWQWAAAAAAQEAADMGAEFDGAGFEAGLAASYLQRIKGTISLPKRPTWRTVAQALWDALGVDPVEEWSEGGRYNISPYHLRIVRDEAHPLYDVRGHETTDPNPKEFGALVEGIEAVGWVMACITFTEERGMALVADGRRRVRAVRAVNWRRLTAASEWAADPRGEPPQLIETVPGVCLLDKRRLVQVKNGSNHLRSAEDILRQLAGIQQLEAVMPLVSIAAMMGVTTQTIANIRSLAGLSPLARAALRGGQITLSLAYRLARELAERQDAALAATAKVPPKTRARAVEAFLMGQSPDAEVRALGARDVRTLARRVAETKDPDLAPLRALFAFLRGGDPGAEQLPVKWRECLTTHLPIDREVRGERELIVPTRPRHQLELDDGVPPGMRVECPQCQAAPAEYCLGDDEDEAEQWGIEENTRIHHARIIAAKRARMPELPVISAAEHKTGRKGKRGDVV